jgi:hypothetical protein
MVLRDRPNCWKLSVGYFLLLTGSMVGIARWRWTGKLSTEEMTYAFVLSLAGLILLATESRFLIGRRYAYTWGNPCRLPNWWKVLICGTLFVLCTRAVFRNGQNDDVLVALVLAVLCGKGLVTEIRQMIRVRLR